MNTVETTPQLQQIMQRLDQLIAEMITLRQQVVALSNTTPDSSQRSVQQADYFGIWANREDMQNQSSRAWLEDLRRQQWQR